MARVRALIESHDEPYDSVSRNETVVGGFAEPVRRILRCVCDGIGCGQCERSAARAAELGIELKPGRVLVVERDPYDTGHEGAFDPAARTQRQRAALIDSTIVRLRDEALVREGVYAAEVEHEKLLALAEARDRRGSYRELRLALDAMPRRLRGKAAVRWLAEHMPKTIKVPRWAFEQELDHLGEQASSLHALGFSEKEIAYELSVSRRQVRNAMRRSSQ